MMLRGSVLVYGSPVQLEHHYQYSIALLCASTGLTMSVKRCDSYPRVGNYPRIGPIPQSGGYLSYLFITH